MSQQYSYQHIRRGLGKIYIISYKNDLAWYNGPDACSEVFNLGNINEYIVINGQKRYWRGINHPDDFTLQTEVNSLNLILAIAKPSLSMNSRAEQIRQRAAKYKYEIVNEVEIKLSNTQVRQLYPFYMASHWENDLCRFFTQKKCLAFVLDTSNSSINHCLFKRVLRRKWGVSSYEIQNGIHVSENFIDAYRELKILGLAYSNT